LEGTSLKTLPLLNHINQIGGFLGLFHRQTQGKSSTNPRKFTVNKVKEMFQDLEAFNCDEEIKERFRKCYVLVQDIKLKNDGLIHGDLFLDNTKFTDDNLTAVFDFIEACNGSFLFDLSVIANSWCFDGTYTFQRNNFDNLIASYEQNFKEKVDIQSLKKSMLFASLFYALRRFTIKYIQQRDVTVKPYEEYLIKFDAILQEV
jgi:homoserine kinase type II